MSFGLLRNRNLALLSIGQTISWFGDSFYTISLMWLVQEMTGSKAMMGVVAASRAIPALFGILAGGLVDRVDKRRSMMLVSLTQALTVLMVPLLHNANLLRAWHIPIVAFSLAALSTFYVPARQSLLPLLVDKAEYIKVNSLLTVAQQLSFVAGYAAGGILIKVYGVLPLFSLDAASFVAVAIAIALLRLPADAYAKPTESAKASRTLLADIRDGLGFITTNKSLLAFFPLSVLMNFMFAPMSVLMPVFVKDYLRGGADSFGFTQTAMMVGMIAGAAAVNYAVKRTRVSALIAASLFGMGASVAALALARTVPQAVFVMLLFGIGNGFGNVAFTSYLQSVVPRDMIGRTFGTLTTISNIAVPVGQALGGFVGQIVAAPAIFAAQGAVVAAASLVFWYNPRGREALRTADASLVRS